MIPRFGIPRPSKIPYLIKEYTLNYNGVPNVMKGIFLNLGILEDLGKDSRAFTPSAMGQNPGSQRVGSSIVGLEHGTYPLDRPQGFVPSERVVKREVPRSMRR